MDYTVYEEHINNYCCFVYFQSNSTQFESNSFHVFIIYSNANTHIIIMISLLLNSYCITNLGLCFCSRDGDTSICGCGISVRNKINYVFIITDQIIIMLIIRPLYELFLQSCMFHRLLEWDERKYICSNCFKFSKHHYCLLTKYLHSFWISF